VSNRTTYEQLLVLYKQALAYNGRLLDLGDALATAAGYGYGNDPELDAAIDAWNERSVGGK
jgi:hypothetical protein